MGETRVVAFFAGMLGFGSRRADASPLETPGGIKPESVSAPTQQRLSVDDTSTVRRLTADTRKGKKNQELQPLALAELHGTRLFELLLDVEHFQPGTTIDSGEMVLIYEALCEDLGWNPRPWNPVAAVLNRLMQDKAYGFVAGPRKHGRRPRLYVVPPLDSPVRRPKKQRKTVSASAQRRRNVDGSPTVHRLRRAA